MKPYPHELDRIEEFPGFGKARVRPVRPEDAAAIVRFFARLAPEDVRLRFFAPMHSLPANRAARLATIDYDREMALLLLAPDAEPTEMLGVVRILAEPDNRRAEFAVTVRSDLKGRGLGAALMQRIIDYARGRGTGALFGDILIENTAMISLASHLGFTIDPIPETAAIVRATLKL